MLLCSLLGFLLICWPTVWKKNQIVAYLVLLTAVAVAVMICGLFFEVHESVDLGCFFLLKASLRDDWFIFLSSRWEETYRLEEFNVCFSFEEVSIHPAL